MCCCSNFQDKTWFFMMHHNSHVHVYCSMMVLHFRWFWYGLSVTCVSTCQFGFGWCVKRTAKIMSCVGREAFELGGGWADIQMVCILCSCGQQFSYMWQFCSIPITNEENSFDVFHHGFCNECSFALTSIMQIWNIKRNAQNKFIFICEDVLFTIWFCMCWFNFIINNNKFKINTFKVIIYLFINFIKHSCSKSCL